MKSFNSQALLKWLNARQVQERVILLAGVLGILTMVWLSFVHDPLVAAQAEAQRGITIANGRVAEEQNRQAEIRNTYTTDPNNFAMTRQQELRAAADNADARLNQLYGELISPRQMSQVLTTILRRETELKLVSLQNQPSEPLVAVTQEASTAPEAQVYKHGMHMVFEGSFIETVRYLRSLERLDGNFFWENLEFDLAEYPNGRISLDIYTLSTEQGWIGV